MAVKKQKTGKAANKNALCRDCCHSARRFEKNVEGEPFMVWCPFKRWAQFLNHEQECNNFKAGDPIQGEEDPWPHHIIR